ncbi:hypothetical protein DFR40_1174 [Azonexus fungiphilus]|uniref:DUF2271 domain-containing protein n=1 Tax=Azonexus fungiphilus TaxID=146940 RepID=A0A495WDJ8_9RHOO|nr:DUF2271 domain-containing protein [Azonexus fungiphilus]RKT59290.1 hypothetical protein DFR40_1174 [Azonexus fungiphilus]
MRQLLPLAFSAIVAAPALAAEIKLDIEVPRLSVAEYHRPYVAVWVERPDNSVAANLAVWYDGKLKNAEGTKWLKDMRQWWRRIGRELEVPIDGVTSATRAPGLHSLTFAEGKAPLAKLPPGEYKLQVEAAREAGGRELLSLPFQWPPQKATVLTAQGQHELGKLNFELKP